MRNLIVVAALLLPIPASATTFDVITTRLKPECSFATYRAITKDFNDSWGKSHGYTASLALPVHSATSGVIVWMGTTKSAEAFGKAWDTWRDALADPASVPARLQARFDACGTQISRESYDSY